MLDRWGFRHRLGQPGGQGVQGGRSGRGWRPTAWSTGVPGGRRTLRPAELREPYGVVVHRVQVGQHVDEALAHRAPLRGPVGVARRELLDDVDADHALHDVERRAEHGLVGAQVQRAGHRDGGRTRRRRDDPVLPGHVVRRGQHGAGRRRRRITAAFPVAAGGPALRRHHEVRFDIPAAMSSMPTERQRSSPSTSRGRALQRLDQHPQEVDTAAGYLWRLAGPGLPTAPLCRLAGGGHKRGGTALGAAGLHRRRPPDGGRGRCGPAPVAPRPRGERQAPPRPLPPAPEPSTGPPVPASVAPVTDQDDGATSRTTQTNGHHAREDPRRKGTPWPPITTPRARNEADELGEDSLEELKARRPGVRPRRSTSTRRTSTRTWSCPAPTSPARSSQSASCPSRGRVHLFPLLPGAPQPACRDQGRPAVLPGLRGLTAGEPGRRRPGRGGTQMTEDGTRTGAPRDVPPPRPGSDHGARHR